MNPTQAIKEKLIALATIAGKELNAVSLNAYAEAVSDLDPNDVLNALNNWLKTEKGFPYPSDVREKVMPEIDDEDNAQDVANSVISAVAKFGYTNPLKAESYIGELGWEVVSRMGGWKHLCETMTHENEGILRAQIRDFSETVSRKSKRGELDVRPSLTAPSEITNLIAQTMKGIDP